MNLDIVPLFLISLLFLTAGGTAHTAQLVLSGDHAVTSQRGALVVGDAHVTVPEDATVDGPLHLLGGHTVLRGTVTGDVMQIGGILTIADTAQVAGTLHEIGGTLALSDAAAVGERRQLQAVRTEPADRVVPVSLLTLLLASIAAWRARRAPQSLENIRRAAERHPVVSFTVGTLLTVTLLALIVFMAFTLVLLPVAVFGLLLGVATIAYGVIVLGAGIGKRLPIRRPALAAAVGVVTFMLGIQIISLIPYVGGTIVLALFMTGLGAVVLTYYGLREFHPVPLPQP